jgi:hypothetical protein
MNDEALRQLCANPEHAYERIVRLQEINADLAGEVDRLWNEHQWQCITCGQWNEPHWKICRTCKSRRS